MASSVVKCANIQGPSGGRASHVKTSWTLTLSYPKVCHTNIVNLRYPAKTMLLLILLRPDSPYPPVQRNGLIEVLKTLYIYIENGECRRPNGIPTI